MRTRRGLIRRLAVSVLLSMVVVLAAGQDTYASATNLAVEDRVAGLDGETIFRGIFFGKEPVAGLFPELWRKLPNVEPGEAARLAELENQIIERMKSLDPSFFDRFREDMTSGNHLRIDEGLKEAASLFVEALDRERIQIILPNDSVRANCSVAVWPLYAAAVGVQTVGVVQAYVGAWAIALYKVVAVYDVSWKWKTYGDGESASRLQAEMLVDAIATRLATK